ncbi:MAG: ketoacyl-ACP synthase III [Chloroflexi bacterium]|nr:ketoacyl-ACP synthase III [Chloroflexota bacterium]
MANRPALHAEIVGWGKYVPSKVLTNEDLAKSVDTSDEWIKSRTGIAERHIADPKEASSHLATKAARAAIAVADINPRQIDLVIVATVTPDYLFPSVACQVQDALGIPNAAAFDLNAGCTGFIYALSVASRLIAAGAHKLALVIGAETLSRVLDWQDRTTCVLFGDGAGAVLLQASEAPAGLLGCTLGADGSGADLLQLPAGGSRRPACEDTVKNRQHYLKMNGPEVYRFAVDAMVRASRAVIEQTGVLMDDVELVIPHQANVRIIQSAVKALKLPPEKVFTNLARYGNTSAASVPIALCEAVEQGLVKQGDHVVLVGFGAGLTWGAALVQWGAPLPVKLPFWKLALYHAVRPLALARSTSHRAALRARTIISRVDLNGHKP